MSSPTWPANFRPQQIRFARQTDQLSALKRFYVEGLGLAIISQFSGHQGYDGLILGLPDQSYQLELLQHEHGSSGLSPNAENLLVFYLPVEHIAPMAERLIGMGYERVTAENPWWEAQHAITIADPDLWRVVLCPAD